jgi:hypothetical protein
MVAGTARDGFQDFLASLAPAPFPVEDAAISAVLPAGDSGWLHAEGNSSS